MTISTTDSRFAYSGDAVTVAFSFPRQFVATTDLVVILTDEDDGAEVVQTITTHYTVAGTGLSNGIYASGTVTFVTAPGSDKKVIIYRAPPLTQTSDFTAETNALTALNHRIDLLTLQMQRLDNARSRSLRLSEGFWSTFDATLPDVDSTAGVVAGMVPSLASGLTGLEWAVPASGATVSAAMADVVTQTTLAAARAELADNDLFFEDFDAVGDGSTDDTAAIVACLAAASSASVWAKGKTGKTYKTTSTIALASGAKVDLNGATLKPTSANTIKGLAYVGSGIASTTLSSSATAGADTIVVTSATGAVVGRYVALAWVDGTSAETHRHTTRIDAISGTTLTIADAVPVAVNSGWTNTVVIFTGASGIQVKGRIDGSAAGSVRTITGITRANPAVVTYTGTQVVNGETYFIDGVAGMTEINRSIPVAANATSTTFELSGVNSSAYSVYTSGGVAQPVCYGLDLQYSSLEDIDVEVLNFQSGCGFRHFWGYGNRHRAKLINCGTQQSKDYSCWGNTGTTGYIISIGPAGAGTHFQANSYCRFDVTNAGGSSSWTYSTGGRRVQLASNLYCKFDLGAATNAYFTNLAISNGNSYCTIYGGGIVGAGQNAVASASTNGVGIWFSDQYNIGNTLIGFKVSGSNDNDIEIYSTDTGNTLIGCSYDSSKVSNLGYAEFLADTVAAADIASATTCQIGRATNRLVSVTGTTTITGFGSAPAGRVRLVKFTGALTLTHNGTSLILPGAANITTAADDVGEFASLGSGNWICLSYKRQAAAPLAYASSAEALAMTSAAVALTPANLLATKTERLLWYNTSVDMNSTGDQALTKNGTFTGFLLTRARTVNPSTSLTTAAGGIYNATAKGGAAIVAAAQTYTAAGAAGQGQEMTLSAAGNGKRSDAALYLSLTTPQGAAATAEVYIMGVPLS